MTITPVAGKPHSDPRLTFILRLGRALHTSGYAAQRLEEALTLAADRLGLECQFFATPTSIMASFGPQDDQRVFLIRVEPAESDLGKLADVDEIARDVLNGRISPVEGSARIEAADTALPRYGASLRTLAFGVVSAGAARILGGGWHEIVVSAAIGLVIGILALVTERHPVFSGVFEPLAAFAASLLASATASVGFPVSVFLATLAGVIVLIPGLMLTTAMTELSTRHLASGTARFMGALVLLLGIAFGIALGAKTAAVISGAPHASTVVDLPGWTLLLAILVSPLGFAVLLKAEPRDFPWIIAAGIVAFVGARLGSNVLGAELGAFVGGLMTAVGANWYTRLTNRPAQIALVPGLLLLVPGSVGVQSLASLLDRDVQVGVETAFRMVLIAVSLVAGILMANVVSPKRRLVS
ncbi:MAG: threonine/serine ThrE exporter family protein [Gemmatimonadales bacterium]